MLWLLFMSAGCGVRYKECELLTEEGKQIKNKDETFQPLTEMWKPKKVTLSTIKSPESKRHSHSGKPQGWQLRAPPGGPMI